MGIYSATCGTATMGTAAYQCRPGHPKFIGPLPQLEMGLVSIMGTPDHSVHTIKEAYDKYMGDDIRTRLCSSSDSVSLYIMPPGRTTWASFASVRMGDTSCCGERRVGSLTITSSLGRAYIDKSKDILYDLIRFMDIAIDVALVTAHVQLATLSSSVHESPLLELLADLGGYKLDARFMNAKTSHICSIYSKRLHDLKEYELDTKMLALQLAYQTKRARNF